MLTKSKDFLQSPRYFVKAEFFQFLPKILLYSIQSLSSIFSQKKGFLLLWKDLWKKAGHKKPNPGGSPNEEYCSLFYKFQLILCTNEWLFLMTKLLTLASLRIFVFQFLKYLFLLTENTPRLCTMIWAKYFKT